MAGEPYFPKASPKGVYREPAAVLPPFEPPKKKPVVVHRPSDHPDAPPPRPQKLAPRPATHWERHTLLLRYPRPIGALCVALGGGITWSTVDSLLHGGVYGRITTVFAPVLLLTGGWIVGFGYPIDPEDGLPPRNWTIGYFAAAGAGLLMGVGLSLLLASTG